MLAAAGTARRAAARVRLHRERGFFWKKDGGDSSGHRLANVDVVNAWMQDASLVDPQLGIFRRAELWVMLRALPGLDLPDFLHGARQAYITVTRLMYRAQWAELAPLTTSNCLIAMKEVMGEVAGAGRRIEGEIEEGSVSVDRAMLHRAQILESEPRPHVPLKVHLDVRYDATERFRIFDFHEKSPIAPFDGRPRQQVSTWRFEGTVTPPPPTGGEAGDGHDSAEFAEPEDWRVVGPV